MKALQVEMNGKPVAIYGFPEFGVISAILTGSRRRGEKTEDRQDEPDWDFWLEATGLSDDVHYKWAHRRLSIGDEIRVYLVETDMADAPERQYSYEGPSADQLRKHIAKMQERLAQLEDQDGEHLIERPTVQGDQEPDDI